MTEPTQQPRTQAEILARINAAADSDMLGFRREVLGECLSFKTAEGIRNENITAEEWGQPPNLEELTTKASEYFTFALGKIADHRGISASRSVDKLTEFAWLLGRDDIVEAMVEASYSPYGAPIVKVFGEAMGWWDQVESGSALERMGNGLPCDQECEEGCHG